MVFLQIYSLILVSLVISSCDSDDIAGGKVTLPHTKDNVATEQMRAEAGDYKLLESFDYYDSYVPQFIKGDNSPSASVSGRIIEDCMDGKGALALNYGFAAKSLSTEPEYVYMNRIWGDFRSDLSFHPLGLSLWVKGSSSNPGVLRFVFWHDSKFGPDSPQQVRESFQYIDRQALRHGDWTEVFIPYKSLVPFGITPADTEFDPSKVVGYRVDIVNENNESGTGEVCFDALRQVTSYKHNYSRKGRFSSLFIQLNKIYYGNPDYDDWETYFIECKELGIDTWIVQYSVGYGVENTISWYAGSSVRWNGADVQVTYPIIDRMMQAAERTGFKIILGLNGGDYDNGSLDQTAMYDVLVERNKIVARDLANKFGKSPAFAGWYITEEFHDGQYGWLSETKRNHLADYLTRVATNSKELCDKPVYIAPALWRGMPAELCGKWFGDLLKATKNIDCMYLQDCCGRGGIADPRIDLPNYYEHVSRACAEAGVRFGVDIESFWYSEHPFENFRSKTWHELEEQLAVASLYTDEITNFSWNSFKPGLNSFEGYRNYYNSLKK